MKLTKEEVNKVAHLARLELKDDETKRMTGDMNNILGYINKLGELDTDKVEPTCHAVPVTNAFREDVQKNEFTIEEVLSNAPSSEASCFKVPKVID